MKNRIVVITGSGSGMGRAIAHRFGDNGDTVYILGRREQALVETAKGYDNFHPVVTDVTDTNNIQAALETISKVNSKVDILVNCAGGNIKVDPQATLAEAHDAWNQIIDTNLTSVFNMIYAFLPTITRPGGRVINISSMAAFGGSTNGGVTGQAYSAAESGVHGLSRTLAKSLAKEGITVNCVAPGVIDNTGFFGGEGVPEDRTEMYRSMIPAGRLGKPEEIAAGVFYLASDEAAYITGEVLNINGGAQFGR